MFKKTVIMMLALALLVPMVRPSLIPKASANVKVIYKITEATTDAMAEAMKARKGIKFDLPNGSKSTRDQFIEAWKKGMEEVLEESVDTINGNALNATPMANKPGWLKATVGTGLFLTGLDVWLDVYEEIQNLNSVEYIAPQVIKNEDVSLEYGGLVLVVDYFPTSERVRILRKIDNYVLRDTSRTYNISQQANSYTYTLGPLPAWAGGGKGLLYRTRFTYGSTPAGSAAGAAAFDSIWFDTTQAGYYRSAYVAPSSATYSPPATIPYNPAAPEQEIYFPDPAQFPNWDDWKQELEDNYDWVSDPDTYAPPAPSPTPTPTPDPTEEPAPTYTPMPMPSTPAVPTAPTLPGQPATEDGLSTNDRTFLEWLTHPFTVGFAGISGLIGTIGASLSQGVSAISGTLNRIDTKTSKCQCIELPSVYKPWALLLPFLQFLAAMVGFLVKIGAFVATIPLVPSQPINNAAFQWFRSATILGVQVYNVVSTLAAAGLALTVYRIIRSRF